MSRILLVDDDAVIVEIYGRKLEEHGHEVKTARDGLEAMRVVQRGRPDLVVLDVMMPHFDGYEVLKFIRSQPELRDTQVVVLSNIFLTDENRKAATVQADAALLKPDCTPAMLLETLERMLKEKGAGQAALRESNSKAANEKPSPEFLQQAGGTLATIRQMNDAFVESEGESRNARLLEFYQRVREFSSMATTAGCGQLAQLGSAFGALLIELHEKPRHQNDSRLQTIASTLDFFRLILAEARTNSTLPPARQKALVVEDDPISRRVITSTLQRTELETHDTEDPIAGLAMAKKDRYGLVLLDIEMSGMDGFQFCEQLRALPDYRKTPVIFVTSHTALDQRIRSVASGGNDFISKPVFPSELALKALTHVLRSRLPWDLE